MDNRAIANYPLCATVISMNKEKPKATSYRFYTKQRRIIKSVSKKLKVSEAEVVRRAIDELAGKTVSV